MPTLVEKSVEISTKLLNCAPARVPGDVGGGQDGVGRVRPGVPVAAPSSVVAVVAVVAALERWRCGRRRRLLLVEGESLHVGQRLKVLQRQSVGPVIRWTRSP